MAVMMSLEKKGHQQKPVFNVDESMSVEDADSASEKLFVVKTMQPRSARGDSKALVARSAVSGARRAFELDPTLRVEGPRSLVLVPSNEKCLVRGTSSPLMLPM